MKTATLKQGLIEGQKYGKFTFHYEMIHAISINNIIEREKNGRVNFFNNNWNYDESMLNFN